MKVRPILFNTEMVRAIINGKKTATRRVIPGTVIVCPEIEYQVCFKPFKTRKDNRRKIENIKYLNLGSFTKYEAPYRPGDILYVRETWNTKCSDCESECPSICNAPYYIYKADQPHTEGRWHPSIHMPKEAARIWLEVINIRAEQLDDIDDNGIKAEGLEIGCNFENIWNSTVKKSDRNHYGWEANPWVWVIEFRRCEKPKGLQEGR